MRRCASIPVLWLLLAIVTPAAGITGEISDHEAQILDRFDTAVRRYMELHRKVTQSLPPLEYSQDAGKIRAAVDARAEALQAARPQARAGDFFTGDVAAVFRQRIAQALGDHGLSEYHGLDLIDDDESWQPLPLVRVNEPFPWGRGSLMLPCLVAALPALPTGLEYRFVHTTLVLVDVDAGLVVDVQPDALHEVRLAATERAAVHLPNLRS
jgi:hypothetical protein